MIRGVAALGGTRSQNSVVGVAVATLLRDSAMLATGDWRLATLVTRRKQTVEKSNWSRDLVRAASIHHLWTSASFEFPAEQEMCASYDTTKPHLTLGRSTEDARIRVSFILGLSAPTRLTA